MCEVTVKEIPDKMQAWTHIALIFTLACRYSAKAPKKYSKTSGTN
jgi:hypothetical protein